MVKKKGRKNRRRNVDAYAKKHWYNVYAPQPFKAAEFCKTPVNQRVGMKFSEDYLMGRVFEVSGADLMAGDEQVGHLLFRLKVANVGERQTIYTTFHGMRLTKDKYCSIVRKNRSLINAQTDVRTTDGYRLRIQMVCTTQRRRQQIRKGCYVHQSQRAHIMAKMREVCHTVVSKCDIPKLIDALLQRFIEDEIQASCSCIFPVNQAQISKVRVLYAPNMQPEQIMRYYPEDRVGVAPQVVQIAVQRPAAAPAEGEEGVDADGDVEMAE